MLDVSSTPVLQRLIREALQAAATDPVLFSHVIGIPPDPWQAALLASTDRQFLLNCSRQSGKSTTSATLAVHTALFQADSLILLLSPGDRQSAELFKKCKAVYHEARELVAPVSETERSLTLANGSRIVSLPGKDATVRGFSGARLILVDEASRVLDALYYAIRPMLAVSGGRLGVLSTPFGTRGFFYDAWTNGGPGWRRFRVPATDCPRITAAFLADERRSMPESRYLEEYMCTFGEADGALFTAEQIHTALEYEREPLCP